MIAGSHWADCRRVAQSYDPLFSVIYARDHLEALLRAKPDLEAKLEPIIARLNEIVLGAEKLT